MKKISTIGMSREEWLNARRKGIGGSDAAAIIGANPYASPLSVYLDKLGLAQDKEVTEAMRQGTDLEDYVAKRFSEATGKKVRNCNKILIRENYDFMIANIDRAIVGEDAGLECKTTSPYNKHDFESGEVPVTYQWQCQHYMAVTGYDHWYLAVLVLGQGFYTYQIDRDENLISMLEKREREFWNDNVLKHVPPLPIGQESDDVALDTMYPASTEETADLTSVQDKLDLLSFQEAQIDALKSQCDELKQTIKAELGACESGVCGPWRVSWKSVASSRIDTKSLRKDHPDIVAQYSVVKSNRVFRVKKEA